MTELPNGWNWTTIGDVCDKPKYGWTTSASDSGEVKLLRTTDLTHGPITWETVPFCQETPKIVSDFEVHPNDIFISRAGSVGVSALVKDAPFKSVFASYLIRIRPTKRIDAKYLSLFLQSPHYWNQVRELSSGIALANINATKIQSMTLPLPPIDEQHKIVEILEDHLSRLDAALADVKQAKLKAAQFRNVYIDNFLKKPEGLKTNLASILKFTSGFAYKSSVWQDTGMPVVKIMNVKHREVNLEGCSFVSPEVAEISKSFAVRKGDLLFNMTGATLGAFGFYKLEQEARMNQRVGKFLPLNFSELNINYLAYFLESASTQRMIQQLAKGAAQPNISPTDILSLEINLPNFAVQSEIVEELDAGLSKVTQVDQLCNITDLESNALRRSLLQAAFTGQLTKEVVNV